jgi:hypothetical protein
MADTVFPAKPGLGSGPADSIPGFRLALFAAKSLFEVDQQLLRLFLSRVSGKGPTIVLVLHRIVQSPDPVHQTRLAGTHGQHLADSAGLKRPGHEKQVP